jgi:hypothetical protein
MLHTFIHICMYVCTDIALPASNYLGTYTYISAFTLSAFKSVYVNKCDIHLSNVQ